MTAFADGTRLDARSTTVIEVGVELSEQPPSW